MESNGPLRHVTVQLDMTGNPIDKGSPPAQLVMQMIDAWLGNDLDRLDSLLAYVGNDYGVVFRNLIVVCRAARYKIPSQNARVRPSRTSWPGLLTQMAESTPID